MIQITPVNRLININDFLLGLQKIFSLFILRVGEKHAITAFVQQDIGGEVNKLLNYFVSNYNEIIKFHLKECDFEIDVGDDLKELFKNKVFIKNALSVVSSSDKILSFCETHLGMIKPQEKYITVVDSDNHSEGNANDYGNDNEDD